MADENAERIREIDELREKFAKEKSEMREKLENDKANIIEKLQKENEDLRKQLDMAKVPTLLVLDSIEHFSPPFLNGFRMA